MNCAVQAFGLATSLGHDQTATWERLLACDVKALTCRDDLVPSNQLLVAQVPDPLPSIPDNLSLYRCRNNVLSLAALLQIETAVRDTIARVGPERVGVVMGSSTAGLAAAEAAIATLVQNGRLSKEFHYTQLEMGGVADFVAEWLGTTGPCYTISTACSSGAKALASARSMLALGLCDAVVAGGTDSICRTTANGFMALKAVSSVASLPFSKNRSGLTLGEGSAICLLTRDPGGVQIIGVGESNDAHHMSAPQSEGLGAEAAMRAALADAGVAPDRIDYLNLHGTGTALNDAMEGRAVYRVFGGRVPCSSTKPIVGHTLGASGAVEAAFCWLALRAMRGRRLPLIPHRWDDVRDPEIPSVRLVAYEEVANIGHSAMVMSNSFGFGGNNCSLVLEKTPD